MSFVSKDDLSKSDFRPILSQRARSGIELLGTIQKYASGTIRKRAEDEFNSDPDGKTFHRSTPDIIHNEPWPDRLDRLRAIADRQTSYRFERLLQRHVAEEVYLKGIPALEERRDQFEKLTELPKGKALGSLELDERIAFPEYYKGVEWHLEPGGWDGYDLYGPFFTYVAGPHIFKYGGYAAVEPGADIIQQRIDVVRLLPKASYSRIYEPGCGGFSTLAAAHKLFPEAELIGSDLSPLLLKNGHITAERLGVAVQFKQRDARQTGEPSDSMDAVLMYALMHEMPVAVSIETFKEALRILKPGGDIVISDPPPFRAVEPFQALLLDWDTAHRCEPFFSDACSANWAEELRALGFVNVSEHILGPKGYPYVTVASKPI